MTIKDKLNPLYVCLASNVWHLGNHFDERGTCPVMKLIMIGDPESETIITWHCWQLFLITLRHNMHRAMARDNNS